jgi:WD40 repeat protein
LVHRDDILTFEFTPDNRWVLTSSKDHTARVWDAETGEPVSPWLRHSDEVSHVQMSPDGHLLATASLDLLRAFGAGIRDLLLVHARRTEKGPP